jgi:hypothetical protein
MKKIQINQHIIPIYLAIVLLVLTPLNPIVILSIIVPLLIISLAIHFKQKTLGIIGIFIFCIISIPQYIISTVDDPFKLYSIVFLIVFPTILLLSQILRKHDIKDIYLEIKNRKTPIILSIGTGILVLALLYFIAIFFGNRIMFSSEYVQGQILLLTGLSLLIFTPLLVRQKQI